MAKYGREQKNQLSRTVTNVKLKISYKRKMCIVMLLDL